MYNRRRKGSNFILSLYCPAALRRLVKPFRILRSKAGEPEARSCARFSTRFFCKLSIAAGFRRGRVNQTAGFQYREYDFEERKVETENRHLTYLNKSKKRYYIDPLTGFYTFKGFELHRVSSRSRRLQNIMFPRVRFETPSSRKNFRTGARGEGVLSNFRVGGGRAEPKRWLRESRYVEKALFVTILTLSTTLAEESEATCYSRIGILRETCEFVLPLKTSSRGTYLFTRVPTDLYLIWK